MFRLIVTVDRLKVSSSHADDRVQSFSHLLSPEVNDHLFKLLIFGFICFAELL